eukprot:230341-Prymnesium_polylepis.1
MASLRLLADQQMAVTFAMPSWGACIVFRCRSCIPTAALLERRSAGRRVGGSGVRTRGGTCRARAPRALVSATSAARRPLRELTPPTAPRGRQVSKDARHKDKMTPDAPHASRLAAQWPPPTCCPPAPLTCPCPHP